VVVKLKALCQSALLSLWSFVCVLPLLIKTGPNIVTRTYLEGSYRLYHGINPYAPSEVGADLFFYPPFFAAFWKFFSVWGQPTGILLWVFLNSFIFWWGLSQWFEIKKNQSKWLWFFLICVAIELDISLRYQQANALIAGLILWALSELRNKRNVQSALIFALATHFKVFPVLIALAICLPKNLAFLGSYLGSLLILFLWPSFVVGFAKAFELHWVQFFSTTTDFEKRDLLDLAACLKRMNFSFLGLVLSKMVMVVGAAILLWYRLMTPNQKFNWAIWYSCFMAYLLVVVPKAESPTFVWMAPAYLFLARETEERGKWLVLLLALSITLLYSSLFPRDLVRWMTLDYNSKTLGNLLLWVFASWLLIRGKVH